jgi:hypothetical protein
MSDPIPAPQYTLTEALSVCLAMCHRALVEVRSLARIPGPVGDAGPEGKRGLQGDRGDKGDRGEPGKAGPTGPAGQDGVDGVPGASGTNGRQWRHRRSHDPAQAYAEGDVVAHDGGSWLALCDAPGALPGDGWAQLTTRGQRGKPGDKGERGPPGPEGRGVADVFVNESGEALVVEFTDGTHRSIPLVTR